VKIVTSPKILFAGSNEIPNRAEYPSAHNYYLDFIYHFGLIAILPILALLIYTCKIIYRQRQRIFLSPRLTGLCCVTLFLLLIDNALKVGLRQPYSGIFTFFLWGLLLSRLSDLNREEESH
jgi:O-antigen ligase